MLPPFSPFSELQWAANNLFSNFHNNNHYHPFNNCAYLNTVCQTSPQTQASSITTNKAGQWCNPLPWASHATHQLSEALIFACYKHISPLTQHLSTSAHPPWFLLMVLQWSWVVAWHLSVSVHLCCFIYISNAPTLTIHHLYPFLVVYPPWSVWCSYAAVTLLYIYMICFGGAPPVMWCSLNLSYLW